MEDQFVPTPNRGVILGQRPEDYKVGDNSPLVWQERNPSGDWSDFTPTPEKQWGAGGDKMNCVTQSKNNVVETQLIFLHSNRLVPDAAWAWLGSKGYLDENGKPNFNDRIDAILNETTLEGNYLWKVADCARRFGLFPESVLPSDENLSWAEYYKRELITVQILSEYGEESKKYFEIFFEWVPVTKADLMKHLKHAPIQIVFPNHAVEAITMLNNGDVARYFDTYDPFVKNMNFSNLTSALKIIIATKDAPVTKRFKINQDGKLGIMVLEGFSGSLIYEDKYDEYLEFLKITGMGDNVPTINIPSGKFFKINDHGKLGIVVSEGFSGSVLFEDKWDEYNTLLNITAIPQDAPTIMVP